MIEIRRVGLVIAVLLAMPMWSYAQSEPDRPWRLSVSAGTGWTDNAAAVGSTVTTEGDVPIPGVPFIRDLGSAFGRFSLDFSYDMLANDDQLVTVGYNMQADVYEGQAQEINSHRHDFWASYTHRIDQMTSVSFQIADNYVNVDNRGFSNAIILEPSVYHRFADWGAVEVRYTTGFIEHDNTPIGPAFDRDGTYHTLGFMFYFDIPNSNIRIRTGFSHRWDLTEGQAGGNFDRSSKVVTVGVTHPLPFDITIDYSITRQWDDYNGIGVGTGFRDDRIDYYTLLLTRPINRHAKVYLRLDRIEAESDGTLFDYDQNVIATGVIWDF